LALFLEIGWLTLNHKRRIIMRLKIEVYSDIVCPWCFLGKKRLEAALKSLNVTDADIHYLPYELNPDTPAEGVDRKAYLKAKFGGGKSLEAAHERLTSLGKEVGINYHFGEISKIPNTFDAHRLLWFAEKEGVQQNVKEALMKAYFTDGRDLSDGKILTEVVVEAGLDASKVKKLLESREGELAVREAEERAYNLGVSGVPFFIFNGNTAISGAQPLDVFVSTISDQLENATAKN
jgi:predicted DsbA family dithiol-disulfide isomerase